jgi:hypothetical protein
VKYAVETLGAKELLIMPCTPMKHTPAYEDWINGEWNPISATASSEILRMVRQKYSIHSITITTKVDFVTYWRNYVKRFKIQVLHRSKG